VILANQVLRWEEGNYEFPPRNSTVGITFKTYDEGTERVKHRDAESGWPRSSLNSSFRVVGYAAADSQKPQLQLECCA
jgi:hypothetical protein